MEKRSYRPPQEAKPERAVAEPREEKPAGPAEDTFVNVTGFFPSKSGKADTIFVTEEMLETLSHMKVGDVLGVSENAKNQRLQLWYIAKADSAGD